MDFCNSMTRLMLQVARQENEEEEIRLRATRREAKRRLESRISEVWEIEREGKKGRAQCSFWLKEGRCRKKEHCTYKHDEGARGINAHKNCSEYIIGSCDKGAMCTYVHTREVQGMRKNESLVEKIQYGRRRYLGEEKKAELNKNTSQSSRREYGSRGSDEGSDKWKTTNIEGEYEEGTIVDVIQPPNHQKQIVVLKKELRIGDPKSDPKPE